MKRDRESRLGIVSAPLTGLAGLGWFSEQWLTTRFGDEWSSVPWGTAFFVLASFHLGWGLRDLLNPTSNLRVWLRSKTSFASVQFELERPNIIYEDQTITAKIIVSQNVRDFACYFRWARPEHYLDGTAKWIWSQQVTICENVNTGPGKVITETVVRIKRPSQDRHSVEIGGSPFGVAESPFEQIVLLEVVTSSRGRSSRTREHVRIVHSGKPTLIPATEPDTSKFRDEMV